MAAMWKTRVRTCIDKAIEELVAQHDEKIDPDLTIRSELNGMMRKTRLAEAVNRLKELKAAIETISDRP